MGAFTSVTVVSRNNVGEGRKVITVTAVGPASYDANGSEIDVGIAALGAWDGLTTVRGGTVKQIAGTARDKYFATCVVGAQNYTMKVVVRDAEAGTAASEVSGDISALTFTIEFEGT